MTIETETVRLYRALRDWRRLLTARHAILQGPIVAEELRRAHERIVESFVLEQHRTIQIHPYVVSQLAVIAAEVHTAAE